MNDPIARIRATLEGKAGDPCIVGPWRETIPGDRWARRSLTGDDVVSVSRDPKRSPASGKSRYTARAIRLVRDAHPGPRWTHDTVANAHGVRGMLTPTAAMDAADRWLRDRGWCLLDDDDDLPAGQEEGEDTGWILAAPGPAAVPEDAEPAPARGSPAFARWLAARQLERNARASVGVDRFEEGHNRRQLAKMDALVGDSRDGFDVAGHVAGEREE